ncbi:MAG: hypothetical protein K2Y37_18105 [Pirellulales bacterium]|nr:hypothetical protein [Pirellulales bacterium]
MSVEVFESLRADRPATAVETQRVHFSQPLRRHLQKIRENLPRQAECLVTRSAAEPTSGTPTNPAEPMSIA